MEMIFRRFYMWVRKHLLGIDDRTALEKAIANGICERKGGRGALREFCDYIERFRKS